MSLPSEVSYSVPEETARVARAIFPKGNIYMRLYDALGSIYAQVDFADIFSALGQPAIRPTRLTLVCIVQFMEGLTDEQAANAVRTRIDLKYLLGLELTDPGFDPSVLSEFRSRLLFNTSSMGNLGNLGNTISVEQRLLDTLLLHFRDRGLLKAGGRVRTDSTHVLGAITALNRLQLVLETMRHALNTLSVVAPDWLLDVLQPMELGWAERYGVRADDFHLPKKDKDRLALTQTVGEDGFLLLEAIDTADTASRAVWLRQVPALRILRRVWIQNYMRSERYGQGADEDDKDDKDIAKSHISWREVGNIPAATIFLSTPYDPEAHYSKKRSTSWVGYKVHLTESCDDGMPHLITHVETSPSPSPDATATPLVHKNLQDKGLLPKTHLVDMGYIEILLEAESRRDYGVELLGPMRRDYRRQAHEGQGFEVEHFVIDWDAKRVECPNGKMSSSWTPAVEHGKDLFKVKFSMKDCRPCPFREKCTNSQTKTRRTLTLKPQELHEALRRGRLREQTGEYKTEYRHRSGIEGTISQGVRGFEMRQSRYMGQAKTHLQHVLTAIGINLVRFDNWLLGKEPVQTRRSAFVKLVAAA